MRILIVGGSGMLGHRLWFHMGKEHEVWATLLGADNELPPWPEFDPKRTIENVDVLNLEEVASALARARPEVVINCVGIIKQSPLAEDPLPALLVNSVFPHRLALLCKVGGIRVIHISTDCVFSGNKGNYTENDVSDAADIYGRTKYLGELTYPHTVTIRTSIIGRELRTRLGLMEWFLSQTGTIRGFTGAVYSGFTTDELARIMLKHVIPNPNLHGLFHVSSSPIAKYDLLRLAKEAFRSAVHIEPDDALRCDRSLNSSRFRELTGYEPPPWPVMIKELADSAARYRLSKQT